MAMSAWSQGMSFGTLTSCSQGWLGCQPCLISSAAEDAIASGIAALQIAVAVAVEIHGGFVVFLGQELGVADLAGPGAHHVLEFEIALVIEDQRADQLFAELLGAAAVPGQRGKRRDGREVPHDLAEIGLEGPEGNQHGGRHAIGLLYGIEQVALCFFIDGLTGA